MNCLTGVKDLDNIIYEYKWGMETYDKHKEVMRELKFDIGLYDSFIITRPSFNRKRLKPSFIKNDAPYLGDIYMKDDWDVNMDPWAEIPTRYERHLEHILETMI